MESNSRRASKVQDAEVKIMSTKFQRQEKPKKKKKKDEELNEMKAEAEKKRQQIEEMMQKTLKKTNKKDENKEKRKSYIVTEAGLVESEQNLDERRNSQQNHTSLLSFIGVEGAKKKLKDLAVRRRSTLVAEDSAIDPRKNVDKFKKLAGGLGNEGDQIQKKMSLATIADTKRKLSLTKRRSSTSAEDVDIFAEAIKVHGLQETNKMKKEIKGLQESDKMKKKLKKFGQTLMTAKAISIMSAPRRNREKLQKTVGFGKQRRSSSLFGVGSIAMKAGSAKIQRKQSKRPSEIFENDEEEEDEFSPSANAMLIRGLGKFKKMYKNKKTSDLLREIEANETPYGGGGSGAVGVGAVAAAGGGINVKSLAAAGKFKNRRYRENNQRKTLAMTSFLAWFEGSQALDRIINLEKQKSAAHDAGVVTEMVYMIKRESARQKQMAVSLGKTYVDEVDITTKLIIDHLNNIKHWVTQQSIMKLSHGDDDDDEDVVISLTSGDPQKFRNVRRFNYNLRQFVVIKMTKEAMIVHLDLPSTCIHQASPEGRAQLEKEREWIRQNRRRSTMADVLLEENEDNKEKELRKKKRKAKRAEKNGGNGEKKRGEKKNRDEGGRRRDSDFDKETSKPINHFFKQERATQTMNRYSKDTMMQTSPPTKKRFNQIVNQWVIYDKYMAYEHAKEMAEERESKMESGLAHLKSTRKRLTEPEQEDPKEVMLDKMMRCARVLERMVNQNNHFDIAQDFKFYDDGADEFRENEGTLLPLWKFCFEPANKLDNTALCWNPEYSDLFAASFGSYSISKQPSSGMICIFSLKNPSYPEYLCWAQSGIMCIDFHPQHPHMIAAGLHDGNVVVYNLQRDYSRPAYQSCAANGKHSDIVWKVKWGPDDLDNYLNFYSVSGDGRVTNWTLVKTAIRYADKYLLHFSKPLVNICKETFADKLMDSGRALAFKPDNPNTYLIGTDEGDIYLCTTEYASTFLASYQAHATPVYNIMWNTFIPSVFISCAAEWSVKIWDMNYSKPLYTFDVGAPVGDVSWAPYSSTTFAVVTLDGKVHVFDMNWDRYKPICVQGVIPKRKGKLNQISFNPSHPIIIVGDSSGEVHSMKLSPNLRKQSREVKIALAAKDLKKAGELEIKKLANILGQVRDQQSATDLME